MARPTAPAPEQLDRSGESGATVDATVPDAPELGTVVVPVEWTDRHLGDFNPGTGTYDPDTYTLKAGYMTPAELDAWHAAQEPAPEPEPGPAEPLTGQTIADFLGYSDDADLVRLAGQHLVVVTAMARAYTRDNGFDPLREDVAAVLTTATARLVVNPEQNKREQLATGESVTYASFVGWSLAETIVLNRYRRRAQ